MQADGLIGVYIIGGRDGYSAVPLPDSPLEDDLFNVFFEADEAAIPQMLERNDPAKSRVFPYCLSDTNGTATFFHNYDPYTSSLIKIASEFDYTTWYPRHDYRVTESARTVREAQVELRTIDSLNLLDDPKVASPTIIMLDTQGSELAILRGGAELITEHTMAIVTEAEFVHLYEGQPLFGDLCTYLNELGFVFADFTAGPFRVDPHRTPIGLRSRPMIAFCDALFLRKPAVAAANPLHLAQLAFAAQIYGHLGYGFHCMDRLKEIDPALKSVPAERVYRRFLLDLDRARQNMPVVYGPTFTDLYPTYERSIERFDPNVSLRVQSEHKSERYIKMKARLLSQQSDIQALLSLDDTPVESALRSYALESHAQILKDRRIAETTDMLAEFGLSVVRETQVVE